MLSDREGTCDLPCDEYPLPPEFEAYPDDVEYTDDPRGVLDPLVDGVDDDAESCILLQWVVVEQELRLRVEPSDGVEVR